jgi:enoyl-CoA hydratase/carnithine racemase
VGPPAARVDKVPVALLKPFELYKPIVAAVNGMALAGGCDCSGTDIRVASRQRRFGSRRRSAALVQAVARWCASRAGPTLQRRWRSC